MLNLLVYDPAEEPEVYPPPSAMTVRAFLADPPAWRPDLLHTLWSFDALTVDQNDDLNRFGYLEHLRPQLLEAAARLRAGRFALLRNAVEHEPCWYLLEPRGEALRFSVIGALPQPFGSYFPVERSPQHAPGVRDQRTVLYDHVASSRGSLPEQVLIDEVDRERLILALEEQARLGEQLAAFLKER